MKALSRLIDRILPDARGTTAVEMALLGPVFFAVLLGLLDMGRVTFVAATLEFATQEAVEFASIRGAESAYPATDSDVEAYVRNRVYGANPALVAVAVSPDRNAGDTVTVSSSYEFTFALGFLPLPSVTLNASSRATVL